MQQVENGNPYIFLDETMDTASIEVFDLKVNSHIMDLQLYKRQLKNEALSYFGLNNANTDKKERLISSEVESNNEEIETARNIMLNARKQACQMINEMFGLNIDVRFKVREEVQNIEEEREEQEDE